MNKLKKLWRAYSARLQNVPDKNTYRKDCKIVGGITLFGALLTAFMGGWWLLSTVFLGIMSIDCFCGIIATRERKDETGKKD